MHQQVAVHWEEMCRAGCIHHRSDRNCTVKVSNFSAAHSDTKNTKDLRECGGNALKRNEPHCQQCWSGLGMCCFLSTTMLIRCRTEHHYTTQQKYWKSLKRQRRGIREPQLCQLEYRVRRGLQTLQRWYILDRCRTWHCEGWHLSWSRLRGNKVAAIPPRTTPGNCRLARGVKVKSTNKAHVKLMLERLAFQSSKASTHQSHQRSILLAQKGC